MSLDSATCWRHIRSARADPPSGAAEGERRRVFGAALEQSEQLWQAAVELDYRTRPIVAYYSIAQAGVALLAARGTADRWRVRHSHGLTLPSPSSGARSGLDGFVVKDSGEGVFQQIARLVDSPTLPTPTTVDSLVACVPEATQLVGQSTAPTPLRFQVSGLDAFEDHKTGAVSAWLAPAPAELMPESRIGNPSDPSLMPTRAQLAEWLAPYPTLLADGTAVAVQTCRADGVLDHDNRVRVRWQVSDGGQIEPVDAMTKLRSTVSYPAKGIWLKDTDSGLVLPAVANNDRPLHPLAGWWALLYAMSMLARYHSAVWTALLDTDTSLVAERVRHVLDVAIDALPWHVLLELDRDDDT